MMAAEPKNDDLSQERTTGTSGTSETVETKERSVKQVFSKFADSTSMSGVSFIKNSKLRIAKAAWSLILLASFVALTIHLWSSLDQYYSYPKTAKINLGFANLNFPDITICNVNAVSKRRLESYNSTSVDTLKRLVKALEPHALSPEFFNESLSYSDIANLYSGSGASSTDYYDSFWNDFGSAQFYDEYNSGGNYYYGASGDYSYNYGYDYDYSGGSGEGNEYNAYENNGNGNNEYDNYYDNTNYDNDGNVMPGDDYQNAQNNYDEVVGSEDNGEEGSDDGNGQNGESGTESDQAVKKRRRKRYAELFDEFNITEFDPTFESWFRPDKEVQTNEEFATKVDTSTKIDALFRKTFMSLSRWERGRLGHNITKMLMKCTFAGRKCDEHKRLFRLHQTAEYGNCWTLSSRRFLAQDAGPNAGGWDWKEVRFNEEQGLSLVLNLQSTDYLAGVTHGYGARIQIHNRGAYPDPYQDGLSIPASMETDIALKLVTFDRLSGKYGNCETGEAFVKQYKRPYTRRDRSSIYFLRICAVSCEVTTGGSVVKAAFKLEHTNILTFGKELNHFFQTCQLFCYASKIIDECGCYDEHTEEVAVNIGKGTGLRACNTTDQYDCVHRIEDLFEKKELSCSCRNPCKESEFSKSISMHQWPSDDHAKLLLAGICAQDEGTCQSFLNPNNTISNVHNNFLKLNIYYEDLNFEEIKEEPDIGLAQILSDVGGAIGLWIGLSVVSFCEVIQLFIELGKLIRYKCLNSPSRRKRMERKRKADEDEINIHFVPLGPSFSTKYDNIRKKSRTDRPQSSKKSSKSGNGNVLSNSNRNSSYYSDPFGSPPSYNQFGNGTRHDFSLSGNFRNSSRPSFN